MTNIKTALISVWDKTNIVELAQFLYKNNVEIISTGGTKKILESNNVKVTSVSEITNQKEIMDGRVKTIHPKIFGGILADRKQDNHINDLMNVDGRTIDLVVVNLYPFQNEAVDKNLSLKKAIEFIDIGGPSMLRAAAKNYKYVIPLCKPMQYNDFMDDFINNKGIISDEKRIEYANSVFKETFSYDNIISNYFSNDRLVEKDESINLKLKKENDLRYGENPHQKASFYLEENKKKSWEQLHGKELSYNNFYDIETAASIVNDFDKLACVIIKHSNPCGFGMGDSLVDSYLLAVSTDPISYFGGIVAFNYEVDLKVALELNKSFLECIVAPSFSEKSILELKKKKNLRLITINMKNNFNQKLIKSVFNGFLIQDRDNIRDDFKSFEIVSKKKPSKEEFKSLFLGWNLVKYVKSNAIVFTDNKQLIGVGAGQMSRVDSVKIGIMKAKNNGLNLNGCIMSSDAFFPFSDSIEIAYKAGISGVIQPGGSIKDKEIINKINDLGMFMIITNRRHFNH